MITYDMTTSGHEIYNPNTRRLNDEIDLSEHGNFCVFVSKYRIRCWGLKDGKIQDQKVKDVHEDVKNVEHLKRLHPRMFGSPLKIHFPKLSCTEAILFFQSNEAKKKVYCHDNKGYYVVKKSFTEGVQYVKQGEVHTYQTTRRPLDIYKFMPNIPNSPLELNTLKSTYDAYTLHERIPPEKTKIIPSNTYYIVIAPCHTCFRKLIINTFGVGNSSEIMPLFATEADSQVTSVAEYRSRPPASERTNQADDSSILVRMSMLPRPNEHDNRIDEPEMVNGSGSTVISSSTETNRRSKRLRSSSPLPRASTSHLEVDLVTPSSDSSSDECERGSDLQTSNRTSTDHRRRAVFAVRKDNSIESYYLRPDSTFQVLQDSIVTGSFAIQNDDMDPRVFEYHGEVQYIREIATFKNKSTLETTHAVQRDLLNKLRDPNERKEKVVVKYFFDTAFKNIEAAYKKFSQMRKVMMIGSCVPAIILQKDATFSGAIPDVYEEKP